MEPLYRKDDPLRAEFEILLGRLSKLSARLAPGSDAAKDASICRDTAAAIFGMLPASDSPRAPVRLRIARHEALQKALLRQDLARSQSQVAALQLAAACVADRAAELVACDSVLDSIVSTPGERLAAEVGAQFVLGGDRCSGFMDARAALLARTKPAPST